MLFESHLTGLKEEQKREEEKKSQQLELLINQYNDPETKKEIEATSESLKDFYAKLVEAQEASAEKEGMEGLMKDAQRLMRGLAALMRFKRN